MDRDFVKIEMALPESYSTFNLEKAVCNHGFFMMAPNCWISSTKTLQRPLRLSDSNTSRIVSISATTINKHTKALLICVHGTQHLSPHDEETILGQVRRMLRISDKDETDIMEFHKLHPEAKQSGFGRIFRSPTLFEDAVKSVLLCNCKTLSMAQSLCKLQHEIDRSRSGKKELGGKRRRSSNTDSRADLDMAKTFGNFPNPEELASLDEKVLKTRCKLGYRARTIIQFAMNFLSNKLKVIKEFEDNGVWDRSSYHEFDTRLKRVKGFGPFVCSNILMCIGFYDRIPIDSETLKHLVRYSRHEIKECNMKNVQRIIEEVYGKYAPFQCLAYWWELSGWYEEKFGRLSEMPSSSYNSVSGSKI